MKEREGIKRKKGGLEGGKKGGRKGGRERKKEGRKGKELRTRGERRESSQGKFSLGTISEVTCPPIFILPIFNNASSKLYLGTAPQLQTVFPSPPCSLVRP